MTEAQAPPLGVMPRWLWREKRIVELMAALMRYRDAGLENDSMAAWRREVCELIAEALKEASLPVTDAIMGLMIAMHNFEAALHLRDGTRTTK